MTLEIALLVCAAVAAVGLLLLAISLFSVASAIKKIPAAVEEMRSSHIAAMGDLHKTFDGKLALDRKRFELEMKERKPRIALLKSSNLKIFEEKQELSAAYRVENLGPSPIIVTKLQVALVNRRMPELIKIIDVSYNRVVEPRVPIEAETTVSVKDFAKVSLPFVPNFGFIKDSCQLLTSLEFEDQFGEKHRIDKDILDW